MKITERLDALRLRAGAMLRERKERAAERKAAKRLQRGGHDSRFWLLSIPAAATLCAAFVEVYWAVLFCIEATGSLDGSWSTSLGSQQAAAGAWHFVFDIRNMFVLIGLVAATIPIVMWSMVWLPVQMKARGHGRWRRLTMICAGLLANALVIMSGTVVMNSNRQDQVRAATVVEQQGDANRAMLAASVTDLQHELDTLMNHRSTYVATAASVGAAAYERDYVAQARATNDPRLPLLERALGSARRADDLRQQISAARMAVATAAPAASTAANVRDDVGVGLNTFAQYATVYRPPFVALICTIIGIFGAWWWVGLSEAMDRHNVSLSGWADEAHRIEDQRAEDPIAPEPMKPAREVVTDAETGEELVKVKPHWRKLKKGKPQRVEVTPEPQPDEVGVPPELDNRDSELRAAASEEHASGDNGGGSSGGNEQELDDRGREEHDATDNPANHEGRKEHEDDTGPAIIHSELSEEQANELNNSVLAEPPIDDSDASEHSNELGGEDGEGEHLAFPHETQAADDTPEAQAESGEEQQAVSDDEQPAEEITEHHEPPITQEDRLLAPPESVAAE